MSPIAKTITLNALVLRSLDYNEADRLVSYWSPSHGRVDAVVKGVKKPGSKLAGASQPLQVCQLQVWQGNSSLYKVVQSQPLQSFTRLSNNLLSQSAALVLLELVYWQHEALSEQAETIYSLLLAGLHELEENAVPAKEALCLQGFCFSLLQVLEQLGWLPNWQTRCQLTETMVDERYPTLPFVVHLGGIIHPEAMQGLEAEVKAQVLRVSRSTLQALESMSERLNNGFNPTSDIENRFLNAKPCLPEETLKRCIRLVLACLQAYLNRPLQAETLFWSYF